MSQFFLSMVSKFLGVDSKCLPVVSKCLPFIEGELLLQMVSTFFSSVGCKTSGGGMIDRLSELCPQRTKEGGSIGRSMAPEFLRKKVDCF